MTVFAAVRQADMVAMVNISRTVNFVSQYQHELGDNVEGGEPPMDNEFICDINHLTTIFLPSDEAWRNTTANVHGLHLVMEEIRSGDSLDKNKLIKSVFHQ